MPVITIGLVVLAFLVVFIKYVGPILYYISERLAGRSLEDVPVIWDFWWPVYLLVAVQVYERARRAWLVFLALGVIRILWSVVVLTLFFAKPDWSFWGMQWLFFEIITTGAMLTGVVFALTPSTREEMLPRARTVSIPA